MYVRKQSCKVISKIILKKCPITYFHKWFLNNFYLHKKFKIYLSIQELVLNNPYFHFKIINISFCV